jgi:hypothetical protein
MLNKNIFYKILKRSFARELQESIFLREISKKEVNLLKKIGENIDYNSKFADQNDTFKKQFLNLSDDEKMINFQYIARRFNEIYDPSLIEFINITLPNYFNSLEYLIAFPNVFLYYHSLNQTLSKDYLNAFEKVFTKKGIYLPFFLLRKYTIIYKFPHIFSKESQMHFDNYIIYSLDNQLVKSRGHTPPMLVDILKEIGVECSYECFYKIISYFIENFESENLVTFRTKVELFTTLNYLTRNLWDNYKYLAIKRLLEGTFEDVYSYVSNNTILHQKYISEIIRLGVKFQVFKKVDKDIINQIVKSVVNNVHSYGVVNCMVVVDGLSRYKKFTFAYLSSDVLKIIDASLFEIKSLWHIKSALLYLLMYFDVIHNPRKYELIDFLILRFISTLVEMNRDAIDQNNARIIEMVIKKIIRAKNIIALDNFTMSFLKEYYEFLEKNKKIAADDLDSEVNAVLLPDDTEGVLAEDKLEEGDLNIIENKI